MLPTPPTSLSSPNTEILKAREELVRIHLTAYEPSAFNPCGGSPTRFAPINDRYGACVPSLYATTNIEAAAFETIFHDVLPGPLASVSGSMLGLRSASVLRLKRDLNIARLHAPDLRKWGLKPKDLSAAPSSEYDGTARWAEAIHHQFSDVDGLVWTSNQCDPNRCFLFFGDRVKDADFQCISSVALGAASVERNAVKSAARRASITITIA